MSAITLATIRTHSRVAKVWHEPENGWFAELRPGWKCAGTDCGTCREDTPTKLLAAVRRAIRTESAS